MNQRKLLNPKEVALTLLDYQPATYFGVQSHDRLSISNNVMILAKTAKLFEIPTVLTTIAAESFSGPMTRDLIEQFPNEPVYDRTSINAWLDAEYRKAIAATGRKRLIVSGWILYAAVYAGFAFVSTTTGVWALFLIYGIYFGLAEGAEKAAQE